VCEEVGLDPVKALAVVPPDDRRAQDDPDEQPCGGRDEPAGETGVARGVEVEDGPRAGEDLAQRLDFADEPERAGQRLDGNRATGRREPEVDEDERAGR